VTGYVSRVAVSPDGRFIASTGNDYKVRVWSMDAAPGSPTHELATAARSAPHLAFSEEGNLIVLGTSDLSQNLLVWDWQKSSTADAVPGFRTIVSGLDRASGISRDAFVVSGQRNDGGNTVTELWLVDVSRRSLVRQLGTPSASLYRIQITPDGRTGVAMAAGKLVTWDLESGGVLARSEASIQSVGELDLLDSGRLVLYGAQSRSIHLMETLTAKVLWSSEPADSQCTNNPAALSAGRYVVTGGGWRSGNPGQKDGDYALHVWALPDLATLQSGEADKVIAKRQMLTLEKDDAELWTLLTGLASEWAEKSSADPAAGQKDLDEKYLTAVRREMGAASPREREAFLGEIPRVALPGSCLPDARRRSICPTGPAPSPGSDLRPAGM
jgi:WD40 repeat protein